VWRRIIGEQVDILKVSHHGSAEGSSEELLAVTRPKLAIVSVGKNNKFGHPSKEVIERLKKYKVEIKRTDELGDIVVEL
jgi:competence protein ComEC